MHDYEHRDLCLLVVDAYLTAQLALHSQDLKERDTRFTYRFNSPAVQCHVEQYDIVSYDFCVFKEQLLAFSNPHSVTISGTAHSLKRISEGNGVAVFRKNAANLEITLTLRHSRENKKADGSQIDRHNVELVMTTWDVNGKPEVTQVYAVSRSRVGADPAVVTSVLDALGVQLDAQSASIVESDVGP
jgi:hypothetical protein